MQTTIEPVVAPEVTTPLQPPPSAPATGDGGRPTAPATPVHRRRSRRRWIVAVALAIVLGATVATWLALREPNVAAALEATGTVEATEADLGFAAGGRIASVNVREGDRVGTGATLAQLDTTELMARVRQARAQAALAAAQLGDVERGARAQEVVQSEQGAAAADRSLANAERDLARARELAARQIVSQQALDQAQTARDLAAARATQARAALSLTRAGARRDQIDAARAALVAARAQAAALDASVSNSTVRAPWDGIVTTRAREPGEAVTPGLPVVTLMNPGDRWVRIFIPENRLGAVRLGARARIRVDAYPERDFDGVVSWISSEAEFTPRNVETRDERVRLVYAARVRIVGDTGLALKPGLPADVDLALRTTP